MATTTKKQAPFAVIMTGGKQYIVSAGDVLEVEMLGDFSDGDAIEFVTVLMTDDGTAAKVGTPYTGTKVKATYMGFEYFIFVPIIGLSLEIQKLVTDYLTDKTVVSRIQPYHDATSVFRF